MPTIKSDELVVFNHGQILHGGVPVNYFASVKNTPEGLAWIKQLRKKNKKYRVVMFSTGTNRRERWAKAGKPLDPRWPDCGDKLPRSVAERFRVYLYEKRPVYRTWETNKVDFSDVVV